MTGSGLIDFIIGAIVLIAVVWIFFLVIPRVSPDALFTQIAQIVVGVMALIALILAIAGVLGFGGGHFALSGMALVTFGVAVLVGLLVLYLVNLLLDLLARAAPPIAPFVGAIKYVIGAFVLIALMYVAGTALFGGGSVPFLQQQHRSAVPFWSKYAAFATNPAPTAIHM